jgi:hypothetical protein
MQALAGCAHGQSGVNGTKSCFCTVLKQAVYHMCFKVIHGIYLKIAETQDQARHVVIKRDNLYSA